MGSRIHIKLTELLQNPEIRVDLKTDHEPLAEVTFNSPYQEEEGGELPPLITTFDYTVYQGVVTLEKDFNYFRHEEQNSALMRMLYEHTVCFTVVH